MRNKLNKLVNTVVLVAVFYLYKWTMVEVGRDEVKGILYAMNDVITKHVHGGNREHFETNRLLIIPEDDFCQRSDTFKYYHPDIVMEDIHTVRDVGGLAGEVLQKCAYDVNPNFEYVRRDTEPIWRMPIQATILFPYYESIAERLVVGKQSICLFQKFNHMQGKHQLSLKQRLMNNYYAQLDRMRQLKLDEQCIANATYMPPTYRLYHTQECKEFFTLIKSQEFRDLTEEKGPQFITKLGDEVHRGKGITVLFPKYIDQIIDIYKGGERCGKDHTSLIAQKYITNPYLYKKHKIEFRIYWFVATSNPLVVYAYKRPLIKRCAKPFSLQSSEKAAHVCNTAIVKKDIESKKQNRDNENEIEEEEFFIDWNFEGLQDRLIQEGKIQNTSWLEDQLYPTIYRKLIHLTRSAQGKWARDSRLGEFFATDFMLTDDLDTHILETNYNPQILSVTPDRIVRNYKMVMDTVELMTNYMRSRFVRMRKLINRIRRRVTKGKDFTRKEITQIIYQKGIMDEVLDTYRDRLDPGFEISPNNLYHKFIDENEEGPAVYNDLVQERCIFNIV